MKSQDLNCTKILRICVKSSINSILTATVFRAFVLRKVCKCFLLGIKANSGQVNEDKIDGFWVKYSFKSQRLTLLV